jgi:hypothetical protein
MDGALNSFTFVYQEYKKLVKASKKARIHDTPLSTRHIIWFRSVCQWEEKYGCMRRVLPLFTISNLFLQNCIHPKMIYCSYWSVSLNSENIFICACLTFYSLALTGSTAVLYSGRGDTWWLQRRVVAMSPWEFGDTWILSSFCSAVNDKDFFKHKDGQP